MRGILIDAKNKTVTEVDVASGALAPMLGCERVDCITLHTLPRGSVASIDLWVDDEGAFNSEHGFMLAGDPDPLVICGNGLIVDCDHEGRCVGTRIPLAAVAAIVSFGIAVPDVQIQVVPW